MNGDYSPAIFIFILFRLPCLISTADPICFLPRDKGNCRGLTFRYYYNVEMRQCLPFIYSKCAGNENNFVTRSECQQRCKDSSKCASISCPKCQKCDEWTGKCVHNERQQECRSSSCSSITCGTCHECLLNKAGQPKCVYKSNCCQPAVSCVVSPCTHLLQRRRCPKASVCVPKLCPDCDAQFYDDNLDEICLDDDPCRNANCPQNTKCTVEKRQCEKLPCPQFRCETVNPCMSSPCLEGEKCVYNPFIRCVATPCVQYTCEINNDICRKVTCPAGSTCIPDSNIRCFRAPCPQYRCLLNPLNPCADVQCPGGKRCQIESKPCLRYPCRQYKCVDDPCTRVRCSRKCLVVNGHPKCIGRNSDEEKLAICSQLVPKRGKCNKMKHARWRYSRTAGQCHQLKDDISCEGGNANIFETEEECQETCNNVPRCPAVSTVLNDNCRIEGEQLDESTQCPWPMISCDKGNEICDQVDCAEGYRCKIQTGGGAGCVSIADEKRRLYEQCSQLPKIGPCMAAMPRYYYSRIKGECIPFNYGGCEGNDNNFRSFKRCTRKCREVPTCPSIAKVSPPNGCHFQGRKLNKDLCPVAKIVCDEKQACKFHICKNDERCKVLLNRGPECVPRKVAENCKLPKIIGPCRALIPSFYYNGTTEECESFNYGGCRGNTNRFETKLHCQRVCLEQRRCGANIASISGSGQECELDVKNDEEGCPNKYKSNCPSIKTKMVLHR